MEKIFGDFNVLEILRFGLSGLLLLFTFLAYRLIDREQQRQGPARQEILRTIGIFMGLNLLGAIIVATAGYFGVHTEPKPVPVPGPDGDTYILDYTSYLVDLTQWTESTLGPVVVTRTDFVTTTNYTIPYFTTGKSIECKPITYSSRPYFVPKNDPEHKGVHCDYILPIGHEPAGHSEQVSSQFTFSNGFSNPQTEWWESRVEARQVSQHLSQDSNVIVAGADELLHLGIDHRGNSEMFRGESVFLLISAIAVSNALWRRFAQTCKRAA